MKKQWEEMTLSERKVSVAKDVKAHILAKSFKVERGAYLIVYKNITEVPDSQSQATCLLAAKTNKCEVCARGAMMLVKVAKWNHWNGNLGGYINDYSTTDALKDVFSRKELELIECFFERSSIFMHDSSIVGLSDFVKKYGANPIIWGPDKPDDRLLCIMQNIIDHDGEFKPEVEYEIKVTK